MEGLKVRLRKVKCNTKRLISLLLIVSIFSVCLISYVNNSTYAATNISGVTISGVTDKTYNGQSQTQSSYTLTYGGQTLKEFQLTAADLKLGDIVYFGKLNGTQLKWRVCGFGTNCEATSASGAPYLLLDNWLTFKSYTTMCFDAPHSGDPVGESTANRNLHGSNNWKNSTMKIWLNSDLANGSINYSHTYYSGNPYGKNGFLYEFTADEKNAIQTVTHKNIVTGAYDTKDGGNGTHTYTSGVAFTNALYNYDSADYQNVSDKVFLPNIKELINAINNSGTSGANYYDSNTRYWLRDAASGAPKQQWSQVRIVGMSPDIGYAGAYYDDKCSVLPACILNSTQNLLVKTSGTREFVLGGDFKVSYSSNTTNAGKVTMTFQGTGNYTGTITKEYNIAPKAIDSSMITISQTGNFVYTGSEIKPEIVVKYGDITLACGTDKDYTVTYLNNINAGEASILVSAAGSGNYSGTNIEKKFTISPRPIDDSSISVTVPDLEWTGEDLSESASVTVKYNDANLVCGSDKDYTYALNVDVTSRGTRALVITGHGNYSGTRNANLTIKDTIVPNLTGASVNTGTLGVGDQIEVTLTFSEHVNASGDKKSITLILGKDANDEYTGKFVTDVQGVYNHQASLTLDTLKSSGNNLVFVYTIKDGDYIPKGLSSKITVMNGIYKDDGENNFVFEERELTNSELIVTTQNGIVSDVADIIIPSGGDPLTPEEKEKAKEKIEEVISDSDKMESILDNSGLNPADEEDKKVIENINYITSKLVVIGDDDPDKEAKEALQKFVAEYLSDTPVEGDTPEAQRKSLIEKMAEAIETKELIDAINDPVVSDDKFEDIYENLKNMNEEQMAHIPSDDLTKLVWGLVNEILTNLNKGLINFEDAFDKILESSALDNDEKVLIKNILDGKEETEKEQICERISKYIDDKGISGNTLENKKMSIAKMIKDIVEATVFEDKIKAENDKPDSEKNYVELYKEYRESSADVKELIDEETFKKLEESYLNEIASKLNVDSIVSDTDKETIIEDLLKDVALITNLIENNTELDIFEKGQILNKVIYESNQTKKEEMITYIKEYINSNPLSNIADPTKKVEEITKVIYKAIVSKEIGDPLKNEANNIDNKTSSKTYEDLIKEIKELQPEEKKALDPDILKKIEDGYTNELKNSHIEIPSQSGNKKDSVEVHDVIGKLDTTPNSEVSILIIEKSSGTNVNDANKELQKYESKYAGLLDNPTSEIVIKTFDFNIVNKNNTNEIVPLKNGEVLTLTIDLPKSYDGKKVNVYVKKDDGTIVLVAKDVDVTANSDGGASGKFETNVYGTYFITTSEPSINTVEVKENNGLRGGEVIQVKGDDNSYVLTPTGQSNQAKVIIYVYDEVKKEYVAQPVETVDLPNGSLTYTLPDKYKDKKLYIEVEFVNKSSGGGGGGSSSVPEAKIIPSQNIKDPETQKAVNSAIEKIEIKSGKITSLPDEKDIKRDNYTFAGFFYDAEFTKPVEVGDKIDGNVEIFAKWEENKEKIIVALDLTIQTEKPYIKGYDDGEFKPNRSITRAEFATILAGLFEEYDASKLSSYIEQDKKHMDVRTDYWYTPYIGFIVENNIMGGYSDGSFSPNANITRAEVCKTLATLFIFEDKGITNKFEKELKGKWYEESVSKLVKAGFIQGYEDGTFGANKSISRAELVILINRILGKTMDDEEVKSLPVPFNDLQQSSWYYKDILIASR